MRRLFQGGAEDCGTQEFWLEDARTGAVQKDRSFSSVLKTKIKFFEKALPMLVLVVPFLFTGSVFSNDSQEVGYGDVVINEIMWMGSSKSTSDEFIELHNRTTDEVDIGGWCLSKITIKTIEGAKVKEEQKMLSIPEGNKILADGYFLISRKSLDETIIKDRINIVSSSVSLSNEALKISLYAGDCTDGEKLIDTAGDKEKPFYPGKSDEYISMERNIDPRNGDDKKNWHLCTERNNLKEGVADLATPGAKNSKEIPNDSGGTGDADENENRTFPNKIRINEILPNPSGDEKENEYIELHNFGETEIDLKEWFLKNRTGAKCVLDGKISVGNHHLVQGKCPSYFLHNTGGEKIILYNPNSEDVSYASFEGSVKEDVSYGFDGTVWRWSRHLTPGEPNVFDEAQGFEVKIDKKIYKNMEADFEVISNDEFKVSWDFGDGKKSYKPQAKHIYTKTGKYQGKVTVSGEAEDVEKEFKIEVKKFPDMEIRIIRINPNPPGVDGDAESITVTNKSEKEVDLEGWSIASGTSSNKLANHPITEELVVKAGKTLEITREFSKFSLGNKKANIELRYPDGEVADEIKYETVKDVKKGMIYEKKENGGWSWKLGDLEIFENIEDTVMGQDGKIDSGFGFGEEEDALEVVAMLIDELERDLDEIYAQNDQNGGSVQDAQDVENVQVVESVRRSEKISKKESKNIFEITQEKKPKITALAKASEAPQALGAQKVRTQDNEYKFTKNYQEKPHYATLFFRGILQNINTSLNSFLN